jgi:uncharacterized protein YjbI with pentapeptide repeats
MNREQTRELWTKGEDVWNAWALALLKRKQELEGAGSWSADWFGEGQNAETREWLDEARVDFGETEFAADAVFQNFVFPGPAVFDGAHFLGKAQFTTVHFAYMAHFQGVCFDGEAAFKGAKFYNLSIFDEAVFASAADFEKCEFLRESTGPLAPAARFQKTQFASRAEFRGSKFTGHVEFIRTRFAGNARFDETEFLADANFDGAVFEGTAGLVKARFSGNAKFDQTRFGGDARFGEVEFKALAGFEEAAFTGKSSFRTAKFGGDATFDRCSFAGHALFSEARFALAAHFRKTAFTAGADFQKAVFSKAVDFVSCRFAEDADFDGASFTQTADFTEARFKNASFSDAAFVDDALFRRASLKGRASFRRASFAEKAAFSAVQSRGAFVLAGSRFAQVPSFREASFRETPNIDYISIADPMRLLPNWAASGEKDARPYLLRGMKTCGDSDMSTRYRRLRQFAADAHDYEREREFLAQEVRCRRFWLDRPFGEGMSRFWFGWLYGGLSNFGRSFGRPLIAWIVSIPLFALVYLAERRGIYLAAAPSPVVSNVPAFPVWPHEANMQTVSHWLINTLNWLFQSVVNLFSGGGCITGESGATAEAFFLSLKNSLFFIGWESPDAARRVYSCLYGFENGVAGEQMLRVPLTVSSTAIVQNLLSAFLIFLTILALRNVLKSR